MRVTIVGLNYVPEPTGIAPYTAGAAKGLVGEGVEVSVITGYPHYPQWKIAPGYRGWRRRELVESVRVTRLRHPVPRGAGLLPRIGMDLVFGLRAVFSRWRSPAVVLSVSPALLATFLVVLRARLTRTPVLVWVQDVYTLSAVQTGSARRIVSLIRWLESATLRLATRVLVIHPRFSRYISQELDVGQDRIDVVRNWTHVAPSPSRSLEARRRFGWRDDETIVLHAGNMGVKQDLGNVVRASRLAAESGAPIRFVLLGDGNSRQVLEQMGPNDRLQILDPLPDGEFEEALASADVLLVNELPGMTEMSVPSKLTTYFNTGLPVLAAVDATSVTADEVELAGGGLRVDPGNPQALMEGAVRLAGDEGLREELGAAGFRHRTETLGAEAAIAGILGSVMATVRLKEGKPGSR